MHTDIGVIRGRCWDCNYLLYGLQENRCPECGRKFDPNDNATFNTGLPLSSTSKKLLKPVRWLRPLSTSGCIVLLFASALWCGSFSALAMLSLLWCVLAIVYFVR